MELPHVARDALVGMVNPAATALLVIDIQVDFAGPDGAMAKRGMSLPPIEAAIDRIDVLIAAARRAGLPIVFIRVVSRPETDSTALKLLNVRKGRPANAPAICRAGEIGSDYYRIRPEPGDIEIEKPLFSSFHRTDLEAILRSKGIDTVLICGMTTDCCVDSTVRDAFHRNFNVFIASDACVAYSAALHSGSLDALQKNCALLVTVDDVAAAFDERRELAA
jgi:nicotinamidase-related amidase